MKLRRLGVALRMAAWIVFLSLLAPLLPLRALLRLIDTRRRDHAGLTPQQLAAIVDRIFRADLLHRSCWKRAAVLRRYLLLNGVETEVVFGVRKGGEKLAGHAWLERGGRPFLEEREPEYVVTFRYPS